MKRLISAIVAILLLITPGLHPAVWAKNWSGVYDRVIYSVATIYHDHGSCTAFSINQEQKYYLTADHCIPAGGAGLMFWKESIPNFFIQGTFNSTRVLKRSKELDLALVEGELGLPALAPGKEPREGQELASVGYALSEPKPFIFGSIVAAVKDARSYGGHRRIILKDNQDLGGMSGGPVVDTNGRVVSMVQQGVTVNGRITNVAYGTSIRHIRDFVKGYWETI